MKRLVFALGVVALGCAAATPASADFAVSYAKKHHWCEDWWK